MNKQLPEWHNDYLNHIYDWNSSFITDEEPMKIQFIPKNNIYTVKDHLEVMKRLKDKLIIYNSDYSINLLIRPEGGFQLRNKSYKRVIISVNTDLQIRCNINGPTQPYFLENKLNRNFELTPNSTEYNKCGLKIFEFVGCKNVPKKVMLYLYVILESMNMLVFRTENYPDVQDVVWENRHIWQDPYLYNP